MADIKLHAETAVLVLQGSMESALEGMGFEGCLPVLNLAEPETVEELHKRFCTAGADVAVTNTRTASEAGLAAQGFGAHAAQVNAEGVRLARAAGFAHVLGAVGPCDLAPEEASGQYATQVAALLAAEPDGILLSAFADPDDALRALETACLATDLPVFVTLALPEAEPARYAEVAAAFVTAGAAAVGCEAVELAEALAALEAMAQVVSVPLVALPRTPQARTTAALEDAAVALLRAGARVVGFGEGCAPAATSTVFATLGGLELPEA